MNSDYSQFLNFSKKVILETGKIVLKEQENGETSFKKGIDGRKSSVTAADTKSEEYIVSQINKQFPSHGIFGEEGTNSHTENEFVWYIDPIDGTTNFWRRIPLFGISIGLARNNKPIVGTLYFPALTLLLHAKENGGAFANDEKIHVSNRTLDKSLYYVSCAEARDGFSYPKLNNEVGWVKAIDCSSFELAQIAMGDAELYTFKNILPHDVVAGTVIVREAGGIVSDHKGNAWKVGCENIIASNKIIHSQVISLLK